MIRCITIVSAFLYEKVMELHFGSSMQSQECLNEFIINYHSCAKTNTIFIMENNIPEQLRIGGCILSYKYHVLYDNVFEKKVNLGGYVLSTRP